jgi:hypothetical protein
MKKNIGIWVSLKRVTYKIRSVRRPLIKDHEKGLKWWSIGRVLNWNWGLEFLEEFLEKGCTRKHTRNRVTRWRKMFGGIFGGLRWIAKRILVGEFWFSDFWGFGWGSTWSYWGGGTVVLLFLCLGEFIVLQLGEIWGALIFVWGELRHKVWAVSKVRCQGWGVTTIQCEGRGVWSQEQPWRTSCLLSRTTLKDELFTLKNNLEGRGVYSQEQPWGTSCLLSRTTLRDELFTTMLGVYWNTLWGHKLSAGGGESPQVATTWEPGGTC